MSEHEESKITNQPQRSRAVFSNEDFDLLRAAVLRYISEMNGSDLAVKYTNLYHRLGRIS